MLARTIALVREGGVDWGSNPSPFHYVGSGGLIAGDADKSVAVSPSSSCAAHTGWPPDHLMDLICTAECV